VRVITSNLVYVRDERDNADWQVGMMVYCCQTYEEVKEGDYGCVVRLDQDGLQDLNVQATWFSKGGNLLG